MSICHCTAAVSNVDAVRLHGDHSTAHVTDFSAAAAASKTVAASAAAAHDQHINLG